MKLRNVYIDASAMADRRKSGIGHVVYSIISQIDKTPDLHKQYKFTAFVPWRQWHLLNDYKFEHIQYKRLPFPGRVFNILSRLKVPIPLDIFLGRGIYIFPNYKNWSLVFSRSITYIHDICFALYPELVEPKNRRMLQANVPRWIKRADLVLTGSFSSGKEIMNYYHLTEDKVAVVPDGIDLEVFFPRSDTEVNAVKEKYGIKKEYIFFLSNIEPRKNLLRLILAYRNLPTDVRDNFSLLIVGGMGWLNEDILAEIKRCQKEGLSVIKPDIYVPDDDLPALHSGASMLIQPSLHEGFGVAPLQAIACGTPVVASRIDALEELLGEAAEYFNPLKEEELTRSILHIINKPNYAKKLRRVGLKRAERFSWEQTVAGLIDHVTKLD